jgi:hypothetical protein
LKLQIIRAIACNIVKHRDFYPTKEVLLKHALGYLGMLDDFKGEKTQQQPFICQSSMPWALGEV